jgi:hypothetical protein
MTAPDRAGLHGALGGRPFLVPYLTPLALNGTSDKLLDSVERGLPVIDSSYSMAGLSTPITPERHFLTTPRSRTSEIET